MAEVSQREWKLPGQRSKRLAWGFSVTINGKRVRQYRSEWTKDGAERELAKVKLGLEQRSKEPKAEAPGITLGEAVQRFIAAKSRNKSLAETKRLLDGLVLYFGKETPLAKITADRIATWQAERLTMVSRQTGQPLSAAAINRPLAFLRAVLRMAYQRWEVLSKVPHIELEKEKQGRLRFLSPDEATRLLAACQDSKNRNLADLVEFTIFTGLRQGEALGLTWDLVERSRGVILIEKSKSSRRREVPLCSRADAVLLRRGPKESGLVFESDNFDHYRSAWEAAVKRARLEDFCFHDLRHTFASWSVQRGASVQEVKELLGHASLAMTMRYAHLSPEHLRRAVARLDDLPAPEVLPNRAQARAQEPIEEVALLAK